MFNFMLLVVWSDAGFQIKGGGGHHKLFEIIEQSFYAVHVSQVILPLCFFSPLIIYSLCM